MKVVDIADEIYRELGSVTTLSIPAIAYWVRSNIGTLNSYINTNYAISDTYEIEDTSVEIGEQEKAILKKMYYVYYYDVKLRAALVTMDTDTVVEVSDQGSRVRKLNRNEISKTLGSVRNTEYQALLTLINAYKLNKSTPLDVAGDDTVEGFYPSVGSVFNRTDAD